MDQCEPVKKFKKGGIRLALKKKKKSNFLSSFTYIHLQQITTHCCLRKLNYTMVIVVRSKLIDHGNSEISGIQNCFIIYKYHFNKEIILPFMISWDAFELWQILFNVIKCFRNNFL